jgi:O-antigen biosynthesis protein WbqP
MGFIMDVKCFIATILKVLKHEGVLEGGTGRLGYGEAATSKEKITR